MDKNIINIEKIYIVLSLFVWPCLGMDMAASALLSVIEAENINLAAGAQKNAVEAAVCWWNNYLTGVGSRNGKNRTLGNYFFSHFLTYEQLFGCFAL